MDYIYDWVDRLERGDKDIVAQFLIESSGDNDMLGFSENSHQDVNDYIDKLSIQIESRISYLMLVKNKELTECVGMVVLTPITHPTSSHIAEITKAIIIKNYRGAGIFKKGLESVVVKSQELDVTRLIFDVREGSDSALLFQHVGFKIYGKLEDYSHYNGEVHSGLYMTASLDDLIKINKFYL